MSYETATALRTALEARLASTSAATGVSLDRLRRRVLLERIVARLEHGAPRLWVLKGGMALEVRLGSAARLTKDVDLGARVGTRDADQIRNLLTEHLTADPFADRFVLRVGPLTERGSEDGQAILRGVVAAELAGKLFGRVKLDISLRVAELDHTEHLTLQNSLAFAGIPTVVAEVIDLHRHAAEKLHAMTRRFGDRENTRARDLVDLVILEEQGVLDPMPLDVAIKEVWAQRDGTDPPEAIDVPASWKFRYEAMAVENDLATTRFDDAVAMLVTLWTRRGHEQERL